MLTDMRKKHIAQFLILSLAALLSPVSAFSYHSVHLLLKDGSTVTFLLDQRPVIVVDSQLVIRTTDATVSYDYRAVQRVYPEWSQTTDIGAATAAGKDNVTFNVSGGFVTATGLKPGTAASLYTTDGRKAAAATADSGGRATLRLPQAAGVYIVQAGKAVSYKFIKK